MRWITNPAEGTKHNLTTDGVLAEFYDTTYADDGQAGSTGFGPLGQFVSRYYVKTLLGRDGFGTGEGALDLCGHVPEWTIDAATMVDVRTWLAHELPLLHRVYNDHHTDTGDWCRWSMCGAPAHSVEDTRCPDDCKASGTELQTGF